MISIPWLAKGDGVGLPTSRHRCSDTSDELHCCAKHLVVAASELARDEVAAPERAARLRVAESQFRSLVAAFEGILPDVARAILSSPAVPIDGVDTIPLVVLLASIYARERWWVTSCSVDQELVAGAKELLLGLRWELPREEVVDG